MTTGGVEERPFAASVRRAGGPYSTALDCMAGSESGSCAYGERRWNPAARAGPCVGTPSSGCWHARCPNRRREGDQCELRGLLEQVSRLLDTTGVVDAGDLHGRVGAAGLQAAHEVAADAAEAVDGHLQLGISHLCSTDTVGMSG
jgi:hypothetical protein